MSLITKPVSWRLNFKFHLFAHFSLGKAKAQRENQANALALRVEKFWGRPDPSHPFRLQDQPFATRGLLRSTAGEARLPTAHQARRHPLQISPPSVPTAAQESGLMVPILKMGKCTRQVARHRVGGTGIWTEVSSILQTEDISTHGSTSLWPCFVRACVVMVGGPPTKPIQGAPPFCLHTPLPACSLNTHLKIPSHTHLLPSIPSAQRPSTSIPIIPPTCLVSSHLSASSSCPCLPGSLPRPPLGLPALERWSHPQRMQFWDCGHACGFFVCWVFF